MDGSHRWQRLRDLQGHHRGERVSALVTVFLVDLGRQYVLNVHLGMHNVFTVYLGNDCLISERVSTIATVLSLTWAGVRVDRRLGHVLRVCCQIGQCLFMLRASKYTSNRVFCRLGQAACVDDRLWHSCCPIVQ